jgi:hypothetical protein
MAIRPYMKCLDAGFRRQDEKMHSQALDTSSSALRNAPEYFFYSPNTIAYNTLRQGLFRIMPARKRGRAPVFIQ